MTNDHDSSIKTLEQTHSFPGPFMFKVIGENSPAFIAQVAQAAVTVLGPRAAPAVTTRESSGGRHLAVTMVVTVPDAESVLTIYAALAGLVGVTMVM